MTDWGPIETAPKKGKPIDLWFQAFDLADRDRDDLVPTVGFRVADCIWFGGGWTNSDGNPIEEIEGFDLTTARFTHWIMPPEPPTF